MLGRFLLCFIAVLVATRLAPAQEIGTLMPVQRPPLPNPHDPNIPAKELFGRKSEPAPMAARAIGKYSRGCLAGAKMLPINGPNWQVMRLSRNRNWAHPAMIALLERIAAKAPSVGWRGLLVGDLTQPRGGPMLTGHVSHQIGLDADVWFTPMPDRELTRQEREEMMATNLVTDDWTDVRRDIWSPAHVALLKLVAEQPEVDRVLVNFAIKKALCQEVKGDRRWLTKIRIVYGHNYHFHIRIKCPMDSPNCEPDAPTPSHDSCAEEIAYWTANDRFKPKPPTPGVERYQLKMSDLPAECREVLLAPQAKSAAPEAPVKGR